MEKSLPVHGKLPVALGSKRIFRPAAADHAGLRCLGVALNQLGLDRQERLAPLRNPVRHDPGSGGPGPEQRSGVRLGPVQSHERIFRGGHQGGLAGGVDTRPDQLKRGEKGKTAGVDIGGLHRWRQRQAGVHGGGIGRHRPPRHGLGADQPASRTKQRRLQVEARDGIADEFDLRDADGSAMPGVTGAGGKSGLDRPAGTSRQLLDGLRHGQPLGSNAGYHRHGEIDTGGA